MTVLWITLLPACGRDDEAGAPQGAPAVPGQPIPPIAHIPQAPWEGPTVPAGQLPDVYLDVWRRAENRPRCALLAPADLGRWAHAEPRAATFGGGWGVAYDLPELRSAFGVAGTGAEPTPDTHDEWPHQRQWRDGSRVGYGPEGGVGTNQLAYLRVAGERCLYNVWSVIGLEHLEELLEQLRRVEVPEGAIRGR